MREACLELPMPSLDPKDPATLLCERCGYVIEGLAQAGNCPECGKPIAESLPERRTGSAWQREQTARNARMTDAWMLRRPLTCWDSIAVLDWSSRDLLQRNLLAASRLGVLPLAAIFVKTMRLADAALNMETIVRLVFSAFIFTALFAMQVLFVMWFGSALTWIEVRGIEFFGARRGWRVSRKLAVTICGHASVGWLIAFGLAHLVLACVVVGGERILELFDVRRGIIVFLSPVWMFLLGMLLFETLVYLGMRRMRFANQPRSTAAPASEALEQPANPT